MATFTNKATLTYNGISTDSNTVVGNIPENLTVNKNVINESYSFGDSITYVISLVNDGSFSYNGLTVSDDLGAFVRDGVSYTPLDYTEGSVAYYVNGVLQSAPTVATTSPLAFSGINVPAGGNAVIVYRASVNSFAPLAAGSAIDNTVSVSGAGLTAPITDSESLPVFEESLLSITKSLFPTEIGESGELTYTLLIENTGNTEAPATANIVVSDIFDPIINISSVTLNGVALEEGTGYTYNPLTGAFATVQSVITVPAATYTTQPDGSIVTVPSSALLVINGTI